MHGGSDRCGCVSARGSDTASGSTAGTASGRAPTRACGCRRPPAASDLRRCPRPSRRSPAGSTSATAWRTGVNGSLETYRSIVNLGSGPKLFGADFTLIDPKKRLFDTMHVRASGWGGDPYGTFHLDAIESQAVSIRRRLSRSGVFQQSAFLRRSAADARNHSR